MRGLDGCGSRCYLPVDYQSFVSSMKVKQRKQIGLKRWLESRNAETRSTLSHHHHRQQRPRPKKEPWWKWRQINDSHTVRRFVCFRWPSSYVLFDGSFLQSKHRFYRFPISSCRVDNLPPAAFSNHIMQKKWCLHIQRIFFRCYHFRNSFFRSFTSFTKFNSNVEVNRFPRCICNFMSKEHRLVMEIKFYHVFHHFNVMISPSLYTLIGNQKQSRTTLLPWPVACANSPHSRRVRSN